MARKPKTPTPVCGMRRFVMRRDEDVSGTSGTGDVAEGVVFSNGTVSMAWMSHLQSCAYYQSLTVLEAIHGHQGKTHIVFVDSHE